MQQPDQWMIDASNAIDLLADRLYAEQRTNEKYHDKYDTWIRARFLASYAAKKMDWINNPNAQ